MWDSKPHAERLVGSTPTEGTMGKELLLRGTARMWCNKNNSEADIYFIADAYWSVICEFGCESHDNTEEEEFFNNHIKLADVAE